MQPKNQQHDSNTVILTELEMKGDWKLKAEQLLFKCIGLTFGTFAKLRKASTRFFMLACPSVSPHATTLLPLDGFS